MCLMIAADISIAFDSISIFTRITRCTRGDARSFSVLTKRMCMHKTKFLMNIFKYCFKNYIKLHEFANCNSANYGV